MSATVWWGGLSVPHHQVVLSEDYAGLSTEAHCSPGHSPARSSEEETPDHSAVRMLAPELLTALETANGTKWCQGSLMSTPSGQAPRGCNALQAPMGDPMRDLPSSLSPHKPPRPDRNQT